MTMFLSSLCCIAAWALCLDALVLKAGFWARFPVFTATACSVVGLIIAALEYKGRKGKKKRRGPMGLMLCNAFAAILGTGLWLWDLLGI